MGAPTIKAVILRQHIKQDGSVNVKIRVTHNRVVKYLPTLEFAHKGDYAPRTLEIKSNSLNKSLMDLVEKMEHAVSDLDPFVVSTMTTADLCNYITKSLASQEKFKLDFFAFAREWLQSKAKYSAGNYKSALNSFASFLGSDSIDIAAITSSLMRRYEAHLHEKHGKHARAVSLYTSSIAAIHAEARKRYNDDETGKPKILNPFEFYKPPKQKPAKKFALPKETIQKLIDVRHSLDELHKLAVDVFLLSFVTMGTNVPDLYEATLEGDTIHYYRMKVRERRHDKGEMIIRLEPICKKLLEDMTDPNGIRAFKLHNQYTFYKAIADKANVRLKKVAELIGVKPFSMKAARHTWPSIAYSIGIPEGVINDCLCHVDPDMAVTDIYIKKDWSVLWKANKKVLKQFKWK